MRMVALAMVPKTITELLSGKSIEVWPPTVRHCFCGLRTRLSECLMAK